MTNNMDPIDLTRPTHDDLLEVAHLLHDAGAVLTIDNLFDYLEKPWHWQDVVQMWTDAGRPSPDEPDWEGFVRQVEHRMDGPE